jgi:hypothetical protein
MVVTAVTAVTESAAACAEAKLERVLAVCAAGAVGF